MLASKLIQESSVLPYRLTNHRSSSGSTDTRKQTLRHMERRGPARMIICSPTFKCIKCVKTKLQDVHRHETIPRPQQLVLIRTGLLYL